MIQANVINVLQTCWLFYLILTVFTPVLCSKTTENVCFICLFFVCLFFVFYHYPLEFVFTCPYGVEIITLQNIQAFKDFKIRTMLRSMFCINANLLLIGPEVTNFSNIWK